MSAAEVPETTDHPPIYDRLIRERGDVLAEVREVAEQTQDRAHQALDWSGLRPSLRESREGGERDFSPFG